jgi:hypothetical protein
MRWLCLIALISLAGCSGIELEERAPTTVRLTGQWALDVEASDEIPDFRNRPIKSRRITGQRNSPDYSDLDPSRSGMTFIAHDFEVLTAERLVIEQSGDSMGVRYVPGVYRDISWGTKQRGLWEVYAGWEGRDAVVISKAKRLNVVERFRLQTEDRLTIRIQINADGDEVVVNRVFRRR